ncbi:MAG: hypothetical protein AAFX87_03665 [Bacteroidota bacterium]
MVKFIAREFLWFIISLVAAYMLSMVLKWVYYGIDGWANYYLVQVELPILTELPNFYFFVLTLVGLYIARIAFNAVLTVTKPQEEKK